ncbi:sulfite exporter TauE/SafE family protein [Bacillus sp. FJAT-44742]|uniref:sulfite exporter TauE/SafE family protein n=1 Tax=Bacillus sp. FJAT-44742 TaxID=2014005 RepID=UPI000C245713|nr:sulfite exporter TauE/SafE family protein [Bacillus sp. FJAT-44742]
MVWELVLVFFIVLLGGFIQGATSFGLGLVVMGFLPLFLTIKESTLLVLSLLFVASLHILLKYRRYIDFKGLIVILSAAFLGRILAFLVLSTYGDMDFLKKWLGFFLIGMVVYLLLNKKISPKAKSNPAIPIFLGMVGGFVGGVFAVGGPFFVFYFLMLYENKYTFNANLQACIVLTSLFTLILHGINGDFYPGFSLYLLIGLISVFAGITLGLKCFDKLPINQIKNCAIGLVVIAAFNLIFFT